MAVFAVAGASATLVAAASLFTQQWAVAAVSAIVVVLGAGMLVVPVRAMCAASLDEDGVAIAMPGRRLVVLFLVLAAAIAGLAAYSHQGRIVVPVLVVLLLVPGVWCAAVDQATHRIPTRLIWTAMASATAGVVAAGWADQDPAGIVQALLWGAACGTALLVITVITAGIPGLADVRLVVVLGTLCGYLGPGHIWGMTVFATMTAGLAAALQMGHRRLIRRIPGGGSLPFGPYLVLGAAVALIVA